MIGQVLGAQAVPTPTDPNDVNVVLVWGLTLALAALAALFWQLQKARDAEVKAHVEEKARMEKTLDTLTEANQDHAEANVAAATAIRDLTAELVRERERRERLEERRAGR